MASPGWGLLVLNRLRVLAGFTGLPKAWCSTVAYCHAGAVNRFGNVAKGVLLNRPVLNRGHSCHADGELLRFVAQLF